ncbi:MAG: hypothetical protein NZM16_13335 [Thermoflexus sp.]|uniref:hypothetical protein n=1 Tax=Thermoflexus sp. TaxID=1969742 RepID=UPI0025CE00B7|nr:hypothetical protein [Thermoflexus sp.]MCS6965011.1 hypothetical protein [Thermoflexus sp.]MDW8185206.1 hypothetical protein [Anaerolineae bacterium]
MPDLAVWRWMLLQKAGRTLRHLADLPLPLFLRARSADGRWLRGVAAFDSLSGDSETFRTYPTVGVMGGPTGNRPSLAWGAGDAGCAEPGHVLAPQARRPLRAGPSFPGLDRRPGAVGGDPEAGGGGARCPADPAGPPVDVRRANRVDE